MTLPEYRQTIADFLARQNPPVAIPNDDIIWDVCNVAYRQNRGVIWTAALACALHRCLTETDDITNYSS